MPTHLGTLRQLLVLFDSILIDDYSRDAQKMLKLPALVSPSSANPGGDDGGIDQLTCDFCGSDIFQSFFECRSCVDGGRSEPGAGFVLCPGCYVEGRTCRCEAMTPMQRRSFDELLKTRARASELFTACSLFTPRSRLKQPIAIPSQESVLVSSL